MTSVRHAACGLGIAWAATLAATAAVTPYERDRHTMHLWHLDEPGPPFADSGVNRVDLHGLHNGARAGVPSAPGCGFAVNFNNSTAEGPGERPYGSILLARPELATGPADDVTGPFVIMGSDGAFTMEAIVKLDRLPSESPGLAADIITMDEDSVVNRVFLFRIEKPGFLSFVPISGDSVRGGGLATIPTSGPHAINTFDWFHVAVTYDGRENVAGNLKFYWTRLGSGAQAAHQIGGGMLTADLRRRLGDFALGNSGKYNSMGPYEFFPGSIDEVRISDIARQPVDFLFVPPEVREAALALAPPSERQPPPSRLEMRQVLVDDTPVPLDRKLVLGPGTHRLDFDFGFPEHAVADPLAVKCRLDGLEDDWRPIAQGMSLTLEALDQGRALLARTVFPATRSSAGWDSDILDSVLMRRSEPVFIPEQTRALRLSLSSGAPDTTGCWAVDDVTLTRSGQPGRNFWHNGDFSIGERLDQIGGVPSGWFRRGTEPAIARVMLASSSALGLLDAEQGHSATWTCTQPLEAKVQAGGEVFLLGWSEAYNVIPGSSLRATYLNVPPGTYTFRAISALGGQEAMTTQLAFPVRIRQPYWKHAWFLPLVAVSGVVVIGWALFLNYQRRARHRLAASRMANAVERDRARIARDMHDDLGTRVSLLKHASTVVRRAIDADPESARHQAVRLESAAGDLVRAMDGLVWAVNPSNDTLEHVAAHLSGVAQEIFRDSPVRLRLSVPTDLPAVRLSADFRHHFSLAVKEALHNVLKHAGPCTATLELEVQRRELVARIADSGSGFDTTHPKAGNGLANLATRAAEMGGTCRIVSAPGEGTRVELAFPLPQLQTVPPS